VSRLELSFDGVRGAFCYPTFNPSLWHVGGRGDRGTDQAVSANDWQTSEQLTRLCTIPEPAMFSGTWDRTLYAMEVRILRPLLWFGLVEYRNEEIPDSRFATQHYYRKAAMFGRLLSFDVKTDTPSAIRH
jgi:hypothetical protein